MNDTAPLPYTEAHLRRAQTFLGDTGVPADDTALAQLLSDTEAETHRRGPGANQPPEPIDPERLIDPDALPPLLAEKYAPLLKRSADLLAATERWKGLHTTTRPDASARISIADEADNQKTSDFLRQIAAFAGGAAAASGAVNDQREKVKKPLLDSSRLVDAWFNTLRDELRTFTADVGRLQTVYLRDKAAAEQRKRDEEARQAADAAEAARLAAMATQGDDTAVDRAVDEAVRTAEIADRAQQKAEAPRTEMARSTSTFGTTTTLRSSWTFRVVNLIDLVKAVAEGKAPIDFLTTQDGVIRASIKAGRREIPGCDVFDDAKAVRTGRTS